MTTRATTFTDAQENDGVPGADRVAYVGGGEVGRKDRAAHADRSALADWGVGVVGKPGGFTLVELIVVIGIVSLLAVTVLPLIAGMWRDTRGADAANRINGLIRSARMRALGGRESGLFFFVESGVQRIAFIEADPPNYNDPEYFDATTGDNNSPDLGQGFDRNDGNDVGEQHAADRFRVVEGNVYDLPAPFRAAPLATLEESLPESDRWNDDELANDRYDDGEVIFEPANGGPQNHRNFFTILFSTKGNLTKRGVVLIHDPAPPPTSNPQDAFGPGMGKVTLLPVAATDQYEDGTGARRKLEPAGVELAGMVFADFSGVVALNFPSVDGLLVYDDAAFREYPDDDDSDPANIVDKREFLSESGQALYISWQTGAIVRGP